MRGVVDGHALLVDPTHPRHVAAECDPPRVRCDDEEAVARVRAGVPRAQGVRARVDRRDVVPHDARVEVPRLEVSSTDLRARFEDGRPLAGPPKRALAQLTITTQDARVWVKRSEGSA